MNNDEKINSVAESVKEKTVKILTNAIIDLRDFQQKDFEYSKMRNVEYQYELDGEKGRLSIYITHEKKK